MTSKPETRRIFVLDTSALLVHFRVERGHAEVDEILLSPHSIALIGAIS